MHEDSQVDPDSQPDLAPLSAPGHPPAIEARELLITVGPRTILQLAGTLRLQTRQVSVILGPNGAGKSTLLRALAGLIERKRSTTSMYLRDGTIAWHGLPQGSLTAQQRATTCVYLSQVPMLSAVMPVHAVIGLGKLALPAQSPALDAKALTWAMDRTGTKPLANRLFHELSAGQQQRVMLARGLCQLWTPKVDRERDWGRGKLLLLDEPASMLDPEQTSIVLGLLNDLRQAGVCCCCVMHDLVSAGQIADQIIAVRRREHPDVTSPAQAKAGSDSGPQITAGPASQWLTEAAMRELFGTPFNSTTLPDGRRLLVVKADRQINHDGGGAAP